MRRFRFRWVVLAVVLAVGLYFVLDIVALQYLESRGANELARALAAEEAKVELGGIPFLPGFVGGRLARVEVNVRGASGAGGLRVQSLTARMQNLRLSWREMLSLSGSIFAARTRVKMENPLGLIEIGQADLEEFVRRHVRQVGDLRINASGIEVRFLKKQLEAGAEPSEEDLTEPARFLPRVEDRHIALSLVGVSQIPEPLRRVASRLEEIIDLPRIPEGLRTDVRLGDGVFVIEATGSELELTVGEGEG